VTDNITIPRATVQQALEALENTGDLWWNSKDEAIAALKAALEQPEQDTAVHMNHCNQGEFVGVCKYGEEDCPALAQPEQAEAFNDGVLYTHPPRREWQGLSEEEIWDLAAHCLDSVAGRLQFARAIEAALKEKNHD